MASKAQDWLAVFGGRSPLSQARCECSRARRREASALAGEGRISRSRPAGLAPRRSRSRRPRLRPPSAHSPRRGFAISRRRGADGTIRTEKPFPSGHPLSRAPAHRLAPLRSASQPARVQGSAPQDLPRSQRQGRVALQEASCVARDGHAPVPNPCYTSLTFFSGRLRTGFPVAAKIALSTAGVTTQMVGSPTPPQKSYVGTITVSTFGISASRRSG